MPLKTGIPVLQGGEDVKSSTSSRFTVGCAGSAAGRRDVKGCQSREFRYDQVNTDTTKEMDMMQSIAHRVVATLFGACLLSASAWAEEYSPEDHDRARMQVDMRLATALKDPASAESYAVSGIVPCTGVTRTPEGYKDHPCIVYEVNAKNSMGGYTGTRRGVFMFVIPEPPLGLQEVPAELHTVGSIQARLAARDTALIMEHVK